MTNKRITVGWNNWCVSVTTGSDIDGAILHVSKPIGNKRIKGQSNGLRFDNPDKAFNHALEHGYSQVYTVPYCIKCRIRHKFMGHNSGFCDKHKEFVFKQ